MCVQCLSSQKRRGTDVRSCLPRGRSRAAVLAARRQAKPGPVRSCRVGVRPALRAVYLVTVVASHPHRPPALSGVVCVYWTHDRQRQLFVGPSLRERQNRDASGVPVPRPPRCGPPGLFGLESAHGTGRGCGLAIGAQQAHPAKQNAKQPGNTPGFCAGACALCGGACAGCGVGHGGNGGDGRGAGVGSPLGVRGTCASIQAATIPQGEGAAATVPYGSFDHRRAAPGTANCQPGDARGLHVPGRWHHGSGWRPRSHGRRAVPGVGVSTGDKLPQGVTVAVGIFFFGSARRSKFPRLQAAERVSPAAGKPVVANCCQHEPLMLTPVSKRTPSSSSHLG